MRGLWAVTLLMAACNHDGPAPSDAAVADLAVSAGDLAVSVGDLAALDFSAPRDSTVPSVPSDMAIVYDLSCGPLCTPGSCPMGQECFVPMVSLQSLLLRASCLQPCNVTGDCPASYHCVYLDFDEVPGQTPRYYCISATDPPPCPGQPVGPDCLDQSPVCTGVQRSTVYVQSNGPTCGIESVACDGGCADGGSCR